MSNKKMLVALRELLHEEGTREPPKHKQDWGPGYRLFKCSCGHEWKDKSRHCESPSGDDCPKCMEEFVHPHGHEKHYEWPTDGAGNLLEP